MFDISDSEFWKQCQFENDIEEDGKSGGAKNLSFSEET
jgi:hypothetical protein